MRSHLVAWAAPLTAASCIVAPAAIAQQAPVRLSIGTILSQKQCTLYAVTSGSVRMRASGSMGAAANADGSAIAASTSLSYEKRWRTDLVRDCVRNFATLRQSLQAALAGSGHIVVVPAGTRGAYTLSAQIFEPGVQSSSTGTADVAVDSDDAVLNIQFTLRDGAGRIVFGRMISKRANMSSSTRNGIVDSSVESGNRAVYMELQREAALAVARAATFKLDPLRVTEVAGRRAKLNYGAPFLNLGGTVFLQGPGGQQIKTNIVSSLEAYAWVETYASGDIAAVAPGSEASFAEADSDAANGRTFERVDLP